MTLVGSIVRAVWRLIRGVVRAVGRVIRDTAEPAGIAQTMNDEGPGQHPTAIGGAMMVGAARRIGQATNEMPGDEDPERNWRD